MLSILLLLGLVLVVGLIGVALFLAWSILLGSLLMHLVAVTLFEASLLVSIATVAVGMFLLRGLAALPGLQSEEEYDDRLDTPIIEIPAERFYRVASDKTWEAWLRYHLANEILYTLQETPRVMATIEKPQRQELAIRLADIGMERLKRKSTRAKRLKMTVDELRQQMTVMELKPYDDDLLQIAVSTLNMALLQPDIDRITRGKLWQTLTDRFDQR